MSSSVSLNYDQNNYQNTCSFDPDCNGELTIDEAAQSINASNAEQVALIADAYVLKNQREPVTLFLDTLKQKKSNKYFLIKTRMQTQAYYSVSVPNSSFTVREYTFKVKTNGIKPTEAELDNMASCFSKLTDEQLQLLNHGVKTIEAPALFTENPLIILMTSSESLQPLYNKDEVQKAGDYDPFTNTLRIQRNSTLETIFHETEHALDDFFYWVVPFSDTQSLSQDVNHPIWQNPHVTSCFIEQKNRFYELHELARKRALTPEELIEYKNYKKMVLERGAVNPNMCASDPEPIAYVNYYTGDGEREVYYELCHERLVHLYFSPERKQSVARELLESLFGGDAVFREKGRSLLMNAYLINPQIPEELKLELVPEIAGRLSTENKAVDEETFSFCKGIIQNNLVPLTVRIAVLLHVYTIAFSLDDSLNTQAVDRARAYLKDEFFVQTSQDPLLLEQGSLFLVNCLWQDRLDYQAASKILVHLLENPDISLERKKELVQEIFNLMTIKVGSDYEKVQNFLELDFFANEKIDGSLKRWLLESYTSKPLFWGLYRETEFYYRLLVNPNVPFDLKKDYLIPQVAKKFLFANQVSIRQETKEALQNKVIFNPEVSQDVKKELGIFTASNLENLDYYPVILLVESEPWQLLRIILTASPLLVFDETKEEIVSTINLKVDSPYESKPDYFYSLMLEEHFPDNAKIPLIRLIVRQWLASRHETIYQGAQAYLLNSFFPNERLSLDVRQAGFYAVYGMSKSYEASVSQNEQAQYVLDTLKQKDLQLYQRVSALSIEEQ